ncbi:MAG: GPW/gp25 family protein [Pseudomonadota bacterium]
MARRRENQAFLGTGWAFPPQFAPRASEIKMVSAQEDIEQSLRILLSTRPGERVMQPNYGCGLGRLMFEPLNEGTVTRIRHAIDQAVLFFEPRITLDEVRVSVDEQRDGVLLVDLHYTIRGTNTRANMVFPFYRAEGTDIRDALPGVGE